MKLIRFGPPGQERPGLIDPDGRPRDLSAHVDDIAGATLTPDGLARLRALDWSRLPQVPADVRLGPPVGGVGKVMAIGLNYADHAAETGGEVPPEPVLFMKATSAICGPNDPIRLPRGSEATDWEVELGVVIGAPAKYVDEAAALDHVAGYCVVNDVSERDYQIRRAGQWTKGKSCDTFCPLGPWLVTREAVRNPQALRLWLDLDGQRMQDGRTTTMVYGVAFLVSYLSQLMTLHPGDVIATGTPPGVGMGRRPRVYLKPGNHLRLGIDGLGVQETTVVADDAA
ncbi:fumarylacetoacetate hydrolase family protein [Roseospira goensis]|uniref:Ureidoglycolate lyase n=1 Tax=Roseospira goensis TaxID=391922 RepID=A0A7W6RZW5_9PROT|nr:fumarylacetoacetate hydrolase family protein [Roseospira goensis]MBB4285684.1 ureidoglycolate lyase [Roseospira goensis]